MAEADQTATAYPPRNSVVLCGRVSMQPEERRLPSGDLIVATRVVVDRELPRGSARARSRQRVDALDCVAWSARAQRAIRRWAPGDQVSVEGSIRRRFFRTDKGLVSRVEIEIVQAKLLAAAARSRAARRDAAGPATDET